MSKRPDHPSPGNASQPKKQALGVPVPGDAWVGYAAIPTPSLNTSGGNRVERSLQRGAYAMTISLARQFRGGRVFRYSDIMQQIRHLTESANAVLHGAISDGEGLQNNNFTVDQLHMWAQQNGLRLAVRIRYPDQVQCHTPYLEITRSPYLYVENQKDVHWVGLDTKAISPLSKALDPVPFGSLELNPYQQAELEDWLKKNPPQKENPPFPATNDVRFTIYKPLEGDLKDYLDFNVDRESFQVSEYILHRLRPHWECDAKSGHYQPRTAHAFHWFGFQAWMQETKNPDGLTMQQMAEKRDKVYWAMKLDEKTTELPMQYPYEEMDVSLAWMGDINRLPKAPPQYATPVLYRQWQDGKRVSTAKDPFSSTERVIPFSEILSKTNAAHYRVVFDNYCTLLEQWYEQWAPRVLILPLAISDKVSEWYRLTGGVVSGSDVWFDELQGMCDYIGLKSFDQQGSIFYITDVSQNGIERDETVVFIRSPVLIEIRERVATIFSAPRPNPSKKCELHLSTQFLLRSVGGADALKWKINYVGRPACSPARLPELVLNQLRYRVMHYDIGGLAQEKNTLVVETQMATFANVVKMETLARRINPGDHHRLAELGAV